MSERLPEPTRALLRDYLNAFANLYGTISIKRALRIIRSQNPELALTDEEFTRFIETDDSLDDCFFIIAYESEVYGEPTTETDPMKKWLIAEYLHMYGGDLKGLREFQAGLKYYIPEREELLKYADDFYQEKNDAYLNMARFLQAELKLDAQTAESIVDDYTGFMNIQHISDDDIDYATDELSRVLNKDFSKSKKSLIDRFFELYDELRLNTRRHSFNGFTPNEIGCRLE